MPETISHLRLVGIGVALAGFLISFVTYRGARWNKPNFLVSFLFCSGLLTIAINPNIVNILLEILSLREAQRGRILTLLILSNFALWFLLIYFRYSHDMQKQKFDTLVKEIGLEKYNLIPETFRRFKPIMVLIPAYEEAENLQGLLGKMPKNILGHDVGVLVIDDGSRDKTYEVVMQKGYLCVKNIINQGQGAASRLGYEILSNQQDVRVIATMDADNQHHPEDLTQLITPILEGRFDLVIGSRFLGTQEMHTPFRTIGILFFAKIINALADTRITDSTSGFKAFDATKLRGIKLRENQFQSAEVILSAAKKGLRIGEAPITVSKRKFGTSKKGPNLSYSMNFLKATLKAWWR